MRSAEGLSPHRELSPRSDMAALPQQGAAPLAPLRGYPCTPTKTVHPPRRLYYFCGFYYPIREVIPIAIYHCNIGIVSRGKGKSAVAAAAYRSGEKITNEWDGMTHDYTRKRGVVHTEILLPPHAPPSFSDRATLYLTASLAPIPMATMMGREWGGMGQNYLRSLFALAIQAFLIIVCVAIYSVLVRNIALDEDVSKAIWTCMGYSILLCFSLFKTSSMARSIFAAH